ncbi:hypothetical protein [Streptomyces sp. B21-083]|uniref:hypothetical protein n=1 Tax=Streptomyces sp. B21-083 TaxID=3039410 RepID=UPI002FF203D2
MISSSPSTTTCTPEADDEAAGPGNLEDRLGDSDEALIGAARAQMLAYLALRSAPASQLRTVPVTRLLIVGRSPQDVVEGIVSLRHLLQARRIDLHEEHHAERLLTLRPRRAAAATTG